MVFWVQQAKSSTAPLNPEAAVVKLRSAEICLYLCFLWGSCVRYKGTTVITPIQQTVNQNTEVHLCSMEELLGFTLIFSCVQVRIIDS